MNIKLALIGLFLISGITGFLLLQPTGSAQSTATTISGKFYKFDVVAIQGQNSFASIMSPSINDSGVIAFCAGRPGIGGGIFQRRINGPITELSTAFNLFSYLREVQINNNDQTVATVPFGQNSIHGIYLIDGNNPGAFQPIAVPDENNYAFFDWPGSINNLNQAVFTGQRADIEGGIRIMSGTFPGAQTPPFFPFRLLIRTGFAQWLPITAELLLEPDFTRQIRFVCMSII